jgi:ribokinase
MKSIVVVGSINLDLVSTARKIPAPGETVTGDRFQTFHGGKGGNQAVAIARLGSPVRMIGKVGDDEFGSRLCEGLKLAGVDVACVRKARRTASGVALITVDANGQNSITVVPGANGKLLPRDLDKALPVLRSAGIILAQLEIPIEAVAHLAGIAERYQVPFMLDPAPARPLPRELLRRVTYLTPNEAETCALRDSPRRPDSGKCW